MLSVRGHLLQINHVAHWPTLMNTAQRVVVYILALDEMENGVNGAIAWRGEALWCSKRVNFILTNVKLCCLWVIRVLMGLPLWSMNRYIPQSEEWEETLNSSMRVDVCSKLHMLSGLWSLFRVEFSACCCKMLTPSWLPYQLLERSFFTFYFSLSRSVVWCQIKMDHPTSTREQIGSATAS